MPTKEEIKTIAITSAVAATAAAAATGLAEWFVGRYVLKYDDPGPQFIVVPVQQQPPPGVEMPPPPGNGGNGGNGTVFAGFGAASPQLMNQVLAIVPACHSEAFDECLEDDNRYAPECLRYEPLHKLYDADEAVYDDVLSDIEYCDYSKSQMFRNAAIAGGIGLLGGIALTLLMNP